MEVQILSVPYDSGVRGVRMGAGPGRLLDAGLESLLSDAGHDTRVCEITAPPAEVPAETSTAFGLMRRLADEVGEAVDANRFPLVLSGSCYSALGTVSGIGPSSLGVLWFDAHADLNTPETTRSGFLDGMTLGMLTGRCWKALTASIPGFRAVEDRQLYLLGTRELDPGEEGLLGESEIRLLPPEELGPAGQGAETTVVFPDSVEGVYVHLDLDVLDPSEGRANAFVTPNGLSGEQLLGLLGAIRDRFQVRGLALTAYDPGEDPEGRVAEVALDVVDAMLA